MQDRNNFITIAVLVEGALAVVAIGLGWLLKQPPLESISFESDQLPSLGWAVLAGIVATLPLVIGLLLMDRLSLGPFRNIASTVDELLVPLFRNATALDLLAVSIAAGLGEEMLFRGFLQVWVANHTGAEFGLYIGLGVASLVFGLCHFVTPMYAMLAGLVGIYLGWLFIVSENLVAPIVCHAAYDFVALLYFCRWKHGN